MNETKQLKAQPIILREVRQHGNVSRACRVANVNRRTVNRWRESDAVFDAAMTVALSEGRR